MKVENIQRVISVIIVVAMVVLTLSPISQSSITKKGITGTPAGWTDDIRLTNNTEFDVKVALAVDGSDVHITWATFRNTKWRVYYLSSTDSGKTWSNEIELASPRTNPDIAVEGQSVHMVCDSLEIYYRNSTDGGNTWNPEKLISANDGYNSEAPKIATSPDGQSIHVIWVDSRHGAESSPPNTEIYYNRSLDGGITWEGEQRLTNALYASAAPDLAINGSNIHMVWEDGRNGNWEVYYKMSKDNGVNWQDGQENIGSDRLLTTNVTDHSEPVIAVNGSTIHVAWVDTLPGPVYYLYYRNSTDNGFSWNPIKLLSGPSPLINKPDMSVWNDNVHLVWGDKRDDGSTREIYYKNSTDGGTSWNADLRLTYNESFDSVWPRIAISESITHITWYDDRDGNREVYYKRYPDFPPDTTPPSHTNETPLPDSYKDAPGTNISVHVTDPSGVNESTIQLWINGSLVSHTSTQITDGFNVSWISPGFDLGVVECRIVADDNCSNTLDYFWNFTVLAIYEIQLNEGWNLISVPHLQIDTSMNEVLRDIDGKWDYILWYDASDPPDHWKTNATFKPQQLNDLFYLNRSMAFWINITEPDVNLTVRGNISTLTEIPLYAGWNLVGYPTQNTETVANALWGTGADRVEVFNASAPYNVQAVDATYVMKPGEGYWVHVPTDTVWVVDW